MNEIKLVMKMMDLENQPTLVEIENEWNRIKAGIGIIDGLRLLKKFSIPRRYLQPQYNHTE